MHFRRRAPTDLARCAARVLLALLAAVAVAGLARDSAARAQEPSPPPTTSDAEVEPTGAETAADAGVEARSEGDVREEITISSRAAESPTASTTVLDSDHIERAQAHHAAELVRTVTGVHLLSAGTSGSASQVLTRGGDANFTLILLDGIPLNDATDVQGGAFSLSTLALDTVDSVEVLRGPHSYFFGSSAVAGAINLVTRDGSAGAGGRLRVDAGEGSLLHAAASLQGPIGEPRAAVPDQEAGDHFLLAAIYDRERDVVADDSHRQLVAHGGATFAFSAASELRVTARAADLDTEDYPEGSGGPVFGSGELRHVDGRELSLGLGWALGAGRWVHRGAAVANRARHDVASPAIELQVPASVEDRDYTRAQLSWMVDRDLSGPVELSLGAQLDRERGDNSSTLFLPPFLGGEIDGDYRLSRTTPGAFAAATVEAGPLVVEGGLRADDPESLELEWSPRLGLRYTIADSGWSARASWSRAFKLPSFFALASPPALGGNPELVPETSVGADAGIEYARDDDRIGVTAFRSTYHDLIDFDFESFLHVNRSSVEAEGVELAARWRPLDALLLSTALTLQDITGPFGANVVLHSPERFGSLAVEWSPLESLLLRAEGRFVGDTEDVQIPVADRTRVEGYEVLDLAARWRAGDRLSVRARLDNATDQDYQQLVGFPQPGRRARVGIEWEIR